MIIRAGVFGMALACEADQVAHQSVAIGLYEARKLLAERREERAVAGEEALVEQADVQLGILVVHREAFLGSAHRLAHAQAGVPQPLQESGDLRFTIAGDRFVLAQKQQVDIRKREELAPAVSADGSQCEAVGYGGEQKAVRGLHHHAVHLVGAFGERNQDVGGRGDGTLRGIAMWQRG